MKEQLTLDKLIAEAKKMDKNIIGKKDGFIIRLAKAEDVTAYYEQNYWKFTLTVPSNQAPQRAALTKVGTLFFIRRIFVSHSKTRIVRR